jgi:hypothetical protein
VTTNNPVRAEDQAATPVMPDAETIFSWVKDLAAFSGRGTQTVDDRRSANYLLEAFRSFGLTNVHLQETESVHWRATRSQLVIGTEAVPHSPVVFSFDNGHRRFSTAHAGLTAQIADVGDGHVEDFDGADVKGNIVLFNLRFTVPRGLLLAVGDFFYDPHNSATESDLDTANPYLDNYDDVLQRAMEAGAVGFVGVLADYFDSHDIHPEFTPGITIPGLWVTKRTGAQIRALNSDGPLQATLHLEGERLPTPARTVIGYLPGCSSETIMIQSHHDSAWDGGVEDASGTAEVLALARYYSQIPQEQRPKTLMFVLMDSHWTGYQAHAAFVDAFINHAATPHRIIANVTLEHIAKQAEIGHDGQLVVYDRPEYRGIFENVSPTLKQAIKDAVATHGLERTVLLSSDKLFPVVGELPTDADFIYRAGVPTISFVSGPVYLYDKADTIDKVYKPDLVPVAHAFADIIDRLAVTPGDQIGESPASA